MRALKRLCLQAKSFSANEVCRRSQFFHSWLYGLYCIDCEVSTGGSLFNRHVWIPFDLEVSVLYAGLSFTSWNSNIDIVVSQANDLKSFTVEVASKVRSQNIVELIGLYSEDLNI